MTQPGAGIRRYLFAGDAAIAQATQVPTMEGQGDGRTLSVQSSIQSFNCWQKTVLDDNVYESYRQEVLPVVNTWVKTDVPVNFAGGITPGFSMPTSKHEGKVVFQFEPNGMVNMKRIFLDYLWQVTPGLFPSYSAAITWDPNQKIMKNMILTGMKNARASDLPQPEYMMLDGLKRVQFCIGKEKLIFEDGTMEDIRARKVPMSQLNLQPQESAAVARLGLRYARTGVNQTNLIGSTGVYQSNADAQNVFGAQHLYQVPVENASSDPVNLQWYAHQFCVQKHPDPNSTVFDNYIHNVTSVVQDVNQPKQNNVTWRVVRDSNSPVTIPLYCLIPFLQQTDTYLPKGLPIEIRFEFEFYASRNYPSANNALYFDVIKNAAANEPNVTTLTNRMETANPLISTLAGCPYVGKDTTRIYMPFLYTDSNGDSIRQSIRIVYDYFILKENILKEFNLTWARQPLLYNYFKWRRYDVLNNGGNVLTTTNISYNLLINQQRPLAIYLRWELADPRERNSATITNGTRYECSSYFVNKSVAVQNDGSQGLLFASGYRPINFITGSAQGPPINLIECFIGSQLVYRATIKSNTNNSLYSCNGVMDSMMIPNRDMGTLPDLVQDSNVLFDMGCAEFATCYRILLTQSKTYERNMYALDRGNTNLQFNIRTDFPANTANNKALTLAMYALYPAQMTIDKSYTAIESQWPVIIAENGPIIESQYNIN